MFVKRIAAVLLAYGAHQRCCVHGMVSMFAWSSVAIGKGVANQVICLAVKERGVVTRLLHACFTVQIAGGY